MKRDQYWSRDNYFAKGEKGDTGDKGLTGKQGVKGLKGDTGPKGLPGNDGADGVLSGKIVKRKFSYVVYKAISATDIIDTPTGGSYNFVTKVITPPDGWSASIDKIDDGTLRIYGCLGIFSADTYEDKEIEGIWGEPYSTNGLRGEDSDSEEKIFTRTEDESSPTLPTDSQNIRGYCPENWTNHPNGIDSEYPYEWVCTRTRSNGVWGEWIGPYIYNSIGIDGKDGDNIEYIFCITSANTVPINPTIINYETDEKYQSSDWYPNETNYTHVYTPPTSGPLRANSTNTDPPVRALKYSYFVNYKNEIFTQLWTDDPGQVTAENPYQWYSMRKYTVNRYYNMDGTFNSEEKVYGEFTDPKRWNTYVVTPSSDKLNILGVIDKETYDYIIYHSGISKDYYSVTFKYNETDSVEMRFNELDKEYTFENAIGINKYGRELWGVSGSTKIILEKHTSGKIFVKVFCPQFSAGGYATVYCDLCSGNTDGTIEYPTADTSLTTSPMILLVDTIQSGDATALLNPTIKQSSGESAGYYIILDGKITYLTNGDGFVVDGSVYMFKDGAWEYYGSVAPDELNGGTYNRFKLYSTIGEPTSDFTYDKYDEYYSTGVTTLDVRYMGICTTKDDMPPQVDYNGTNYNNVSAYTWYFIKGYDGAKEQYIYTRTTGNTLDDIPDVPMYASDKITPLNTLEEDEWDWVDENQVIWTDDSQGISEEWPYEWVCKRVKSQNKWGDYTGSIQKEGKAKLYLYYNFDMSTEAGRGVSYYFAGEWDEKYLYVRDTNKAPIVCITQTDGSSKYYYLYNDSLPCYSCYNLDKIDSSSIPSNIISSVTEEGKTVLKDATGSILEIDSSAPSSLTIWNEMDEIPVVSSEIILADFAKMGQSIFCGDYMYSQKGIDYYDAEYSGYTDFYKFDPFYELTDYDTDKYENAYEYYKENGCTDEETLSRYGYIIKNGVLYDKEGNELEMKEIYPTGYFLPNWCVDFRTGKMWCNNGRTVFNNNEGLIMYNNENEKIFYINEAGDLQISGTINKPTHIIDDIEDLCQFFIPAPISYNKSSFQEKPTPTSEYVTINMDYFTVGNIGFSPDSYTYDMYLDYDWGEDKNKIITLTDFYDNIIPYYDEFTIKLSDGTSGTTSGVSPFICFNNNREDTQRQIISTTHKDNCYDIVTQQGKNFYNFKDNCLLFNMSFDMTYTNAIFEFKNDFYQGNFILKDNIKNYQDLFTKRDNCVKNFDDDKLKWYTNGYNILFPFFKFYSDIENGTVVKKIRDSRLTPTRISIDKEILDENDNVIGFKKERELHYITLEEMLLSVGKKIIIKNKSNKPIFLTTVEDKIFHNEDGDMRIGNKRSNYGWIHFIPTDDSLEKTDYQYNADISSEEFQTACYDYYDIKSGTKIPLYLYTYDCGNTFVKNTHLLINNKGRVYVSTYHLSPVESVGVIDEYRLDDDAYFKQFTILDYRKFLENFSLELKDSEGTKKEIGTIGGKTYYKYSMENNTKVNDDKRPNHYIEFLNPGEIATLEFINETEKQTILDENDEETEVLNDFYHWKVISISMLPKDSDGNYIDNEENGYIYG